MGEDLREALMRLYSAPCDQLARLLECERTMAMQLQIDAAERVLSADGRVTELQFRKEGNVVW